MIRVRPLRNLNRPRHTSKTRQLVCDKVTDTVLHGGPSMSFENAYRTMYQCQVESDDHIPAAVAHFEDRFRTGQWQSGRNWRMLHDCWLYPLRRSAHAHAIEAAFNRVMACIRSYPRLLDEICQKYALPADLRRLLGTYI